jgi:hypothetical protein
VPGYSGAGQAGFIDVNREQYLWLNEVIAAGSAPASLSLAYQLRRLDNAPYPWGASFELQFFGNPGTFEVDILGANIDAPQNYTFLGSITAATSYVPGYYTGRWDMPSNIWPRYVVAYMNTLTNAVAATLMALR